MPILIIDTSRDLCASAIIDDRLENCNNFSIEYLSRGHAEHLIPQIMQLCHDSGYDIKDLDYIAVNTGPGSFTGVRIGVATARALAIDSVTQTIGISIFCAFAQLAAIKIASLELHINRDIAIILSATPHSYNYLILSYNSLTNWQEFPLNKSQTIEKAELSRIINNKQLYIIGDAASDFTEQNNITKLEYEENELLSAFADITKDFIQNNAIATSPCDGELKIAISSPPKPVYMQKYGQQS